MMTFVAPYLKFNPQNQPKYSTFVMFSSWIDQFVLNYNAATYLELGTKAIFAHWIIFLQYSLKIFSDPKNVSWK